MSEDDLPLTLTPGHLTPQTLHDIIKVALVDTLHAHEWHVERTARALSIGRATLYRFMRKYRIKKP